MVLFLYDSVRASPLQGAYHVGGLIGFALLLLLGVGAAVRFTLPAIETALLYFPLRHHVAQPSNVGLRAEELRPRAADGTHLHGWWLRSPTAAAIDAPRPVVIWFSGNGGNVSGGLENARRLIDRLDVEIVSVDYRGYGLSDGAPTEAGLYQDGRAIYDAVRARGVPAQRIVLFGRSLGAAVAVDVAFDRSIAGLVLETPFLSVPTLARTHYPLVPGFLIRSRYDNARKVPDIIVPKLIVQAEHDEVAPPEHAARLYELAIQPKRLHVLAGAHHNDTFAEDSAGYFRVWSELLESARRT